MTVQISSPIEVLKMAEINVPIVTIPQLHDSLQTISATDFIPIVQGSEYDRDAAATLSEILASNPFQDQKEWKTFLLSAAALDTGTWTHNALVLLDAWESSISYSGTSIKNGIMILIPKWSAAPEGTTSCTFAETEGTTCQILRGNFLLIRFGLDGKISSYFSIPASSVDAIAQLKSLSVTNAVNAANVTSTNTVNANVIAGDIIHSNIVNATNVTATNAVNANAVNAENVTATSGVSAAVVDAGTANVTNANATNVTITSNFTTTSIMSYTANVDLSTYVVDHHMIVGQHLFIINSGTADITVTGKVTSGSSEITKTWTLAIGTMCDFVAVPTASGSNAIAKLG